MIPSWFIEFRDREGFWRNISAVQARIITIDLDIRRDIIENLGTLLTTYTRLDGIEEKNLWAWQLLDSRAMEKTLARLFAETSWLRLNLKDVFRLLDVEGHPIYSFNIRKVKFLCFPDEGYCSKQTFKMILQALCLYMYIRVVAETKTFSHAVLVFYIFNNLMREH